jgi:hypothetical protein
MTLPRRDFGVPKRAGLRPLLLVTLGLVPAAAAQSLDGPVTGTLDCPAPSIFESGSTPVRGTIRNGEISVTLPGLTVSGTILNLGAQAVQLSGTSARRSAAFTGVVIGGNQIHARGVLDERPCNLNLALAARGAPVPERPVPERPVAAPPQRQPAPAQPAATSQGFDGPWSGTVNCPTRSLFDSGETQARGTIVNNTLTLSFGDVRVTGRIIGVSPRPMLRLDGEGARSGGASFDGVIVAPDRIHARGLVGQQPCNVNITPSRAAAPQEAARPATPQQASRPPAPQPAPAAGKPLPGGTQAAIPPAASPLPAGSPDKPPALGEAAPAPAPIPEPPRPPPVAAAPPARPATPAPAAPPSRVPSPAVADQMACALAGTCPPPAR